MQPTSSTDKRKRERSENGGVEANAFGSKKCGGGQFVDQSELMRQCGK